MHEKHIQFNSRYHQLIHELRFVLYQMLYSNLALKETRVVKKSCGFKNACFFLAILNRIKRKWRFHNCGNTTRGNYSALLQFIKKEVRSDPKRRELFFVRTKNK